MAVLVLELGLFKEIRVGIESIYQIILPSSALAGNKPRCYGVQLENFNLLKLFERFFKVFLRDCCQTFSVQIWVWFGLI